MVADPSPRKKEKHYMVKNNFSHLKKHTHTQKKTTKKSSCDQQEPTHSFPKSTNGSLGWLTHLTL